MSNENIALFWQMKKNLASGNGATDSSYIRNLLYRMDSLKLKRYNAQITEKYYVNSFGVVVDREFHGNLWKHNNLIDESYLLSEHFFETVSIIDAIEKAESSFKMLELGCGCGRWLAMAARVIDDNYHIPYRLIGIEPEPNHYRWAQACLKRNHVSPGDFLLLNKAIVPRDGRYFLQICNNNAPIEDEQTPMKWYGQSIHRYEEMKEHIDILLTESRNVTFQNLPVTFLKYGEGYIPVDDDRLIRLQDMAKEEEYFNIVTADIQGLEGDVFENAADFLQKHVERVHIGTHAADTEKRLRKIFKNMGWMCIFDFPCNSVLEDEMGDVMFVDGILSYVNPCFHKGKGLLP